MLHKIQILIILALIPIGAALLYSKHEGRSLTESFSWGTPIVHVGEIPIKVEIADTPESRIKGLSGRAALEVGTGMFFLFDTIDRHSMWMKDMNFPIDIIWIDESLTVVGIDENVRPDSYPRKFYAPAPVRFAIETQDRFTETFGIHVGAKVRLPLDVEREIAK